MRSVNVEVERRDGEPIEKMLKRFGKKMKNEKILENVIENLTYKKPSIERHFQKKRKTRLSRWTTRQHQIAK